MRPTTPANRFESFHTDPFQTSFKVSPVRSRRPVQVQQRPQERLRPQLRVRPQAHQEATEALVTVSPTNPRSRGRGQRVQTRPEPRRLPEQEDVTRNPVNVLRAIASGETSSRTRSRASLSGGRSRSSTSPTNRQQQQQQQQGNSVSASGSRFASFPARNGNSQPQRQRQQQQPPRHQQQPQREQPLRQQTQDVQLLPPRPQSRPRFPVTPARNAAAATPRRTPPAPAVDFDALLQEFTGRNQPDAINNPLRQFKAVPAVPVVQQNGASFTINTGFN